MGENRFSETCLLCKRNWAFWIWSWVPVMVIIRSSDPSRGSSILIAAPESWRICLIRWPPLPMMEPASCHMWKDKEMDWRRWRRLKKNIWVPQIVSVKVKHKCLVEVLWCVFISKIWERTIIQCEWHVHMLVQGQRTQYKCSVMCQSEWQPVIYLHLWGLSPVWWQQGRQCHCRSNDHLMHEKDKGDIKIRR